MSNEIRAMWPRFDELAAKTESADTKLLIEAIKIHAEIMNMRLAMIEINSAKQPQGTTAAALSPFGKRS